MKNLPKYVQRKRDGFHFQRSIPSSLKHKTTQKFFCQTLKLKSDATYLQIAQAAEEANKVFELHCRVIEAQSFASLNETEIDKLVDNNLKLHGLSRGEMIHVVSEARASGDVRPDSVIEFDASLYVDSIFPELDDIDRKISSREQLTQQEYLTKRTVNALYESGLKRSSSRLSMLWDLYCPPNSPKAQNSATKKAQRRWQNFVDVCGDILITQDTVVVFNDALHRYRDKRRGVVKEASIGRELNDILAVLRHGFSYLGLNFHLNKPKLEISDVVERDVFSDDDLLVLVQACLARESSDYRTEGKYAAIIILGLLGGLIPKEIYALKDSEIQLDTDYPYIVLRQVLKKKVRRRLIPIVFGVEVLKNHLPSAMAWVNRTTGSNWSAVLKGFIRKQTGSKTQSMYACRHTFKQAGILSDVSQQSLNDIGGWTGDRAISRDMLSYASSGLERSERVRKLFQDARKIHQRLLTMLESKSISTS